GAARTLWAAADFDGDNTLDLARITASGAVVSRLCPASLLRLSPPLSLKLSTEDVDGDDDQDLVLTAPFESRAIRVWLNDGDGSFFEAETARFPDAGRHGSSVGNQSSASSITLSAAA